MIHTANPAATLQTVEPPLNDRLLQFIEERGDYLFPHAKDTTSALFRLNALSGCDHAIAAQELAQLVLTDPGFAFNFARFCKEEGRALDRTVHIEDVNGEAEIALKAAELGIDAQTYKTELASLEVESESLGSGIVTDPKAPLPTTIVEAINMFGPFYVVSMFSSTEDHAQVFADHPKVGSLYRKIASEASRHAKRIHGEVPPDQSLVATYMVLNAALPMLSIASMAPEVSLRILLAGDHLGEVTEDLLGFKISELIPYLEGNHRIPRNNNPEYGVVTRTAAMHAQKELRTFLRDPLTKVA